MSFGYAAPVRLERNLRIDACGTPRGRQPEEDTGCHGNSQRERQHTPVDGQVEEHRVRALREQSHEKRRPQARERNADERAHSGEQNALRQELPSDPSSCGSDRHPDRHLPRANGRAREEQVGDVGARNEQHDTDGDHEHRQRPLILPSNFREAGGRGGNAQRVLTVLGLLVRTPVVRHRGSENDRSKRRYAVVRLLRRDAGLRPSDDVQVPAAPVREVRLKTERRVHLTRFADADAGERCVGNANDHVRRAVERDRFANDRGRASELALPEPIAQYRGGSASGDVVSPGKETACRRPDTQRNEVVAAHHVAMRDADFAPRREVVGRPTVREDPGENVLPVADLLPDRVGELGHAPIGTERDAEELLRALDREGSQDNGVEQAEDRRVRSNAEA